MINLVFQIVSGLVRLAIQLGWAVGVLLGRLLVLVVSAIRRTMRRRAAPPSAAPIAGVAQESATRRNIVRPVHSFHRPRPAIRPRPSAR